MTRQSPLTRVSNASIQKNVRALDGGDQILVRAKDAQSESVAVAVRMIFTMALGAALLCLLFALLIKELPLRRTVQTSQPPGRAQSDPDVPLREPDPVVAH